MNNLFTNLSRALGLALLVVASSAQADTLYVSGSRNGSDVIEAFTSTGAGIDFVTTGLSNPQGMCFDSQGNLFVANEGSSTIEKFTTSGVGSVFTTGLSDPVGVVFDHSGNLFVSNFLGNSVVSKVSPTGVVSQFADYPSARLDVPYGLAIDSAGNLYVANYMGNSITKFTGSVPTVFATGLSNPTGLAFDKSGNLFVANSSNDTIKKITPSGLVSVFATTGLHNPQGMAFDSIGNLYVANYSSFSLGIPDTIQKFTPAGVASVFTSSLESPRFIAISKTNISVTKIILLSGSLAFGGVLPHAGKSETFTISNQGNAPLKVTSITYPNGYSGNWFGTIPAGGNQLVYVTFQPPSLGTYNGLATVNSDATSGTATIAVSGIGGSLPVFTSATSATFTVGKAGTFKVTATGSPAPTFSTDDGLGLPTWAHLNATTGVITGTPLNADPLPPIIFVADNGTGSRSQVFSLTVQKASQTISFPAISGGKVGNVLTLAATASSGLPVSFVLSGPATLSGNTLTLTGVGAVTVTASQAGNSAYLAATNVKESFVVTQNTQKITFPVVGDQLVGNAVTLNAKSTSGLTITYAVTGPAILSGRTLKLTGAGTVRITASQAGNASYAAAANVVQNLTVYSAIQKQTITFPVIANRAFGSAPVALGATASSGLAIAYTATGPVTIANGVATLTGAGTVQIKASQPGNAVYSAARIVLVTFTVTPATQTITFPAVAAQITGAKVKLAAKSSSGLPITYKRISGSATISGNVLTCTGIGRVTVQATQAGNTNYKAAAGVSINFVVSKAP